MKATVTVLVFVLVASMFMPLGLVSAELPHVPHEDPAQAESMLDSLSFLSQYLQVFSLMSQRQYQNASELSVLLSQISVPADLSYIISRYNDLTQQLIEQLNDLDVTLNRVSVLLSQYRLDEAGPELDHAGVVVVKAEILLGDLVDATSTVISRLGVLAAPAESEVRQVYGELQRMIERLKDLLDQYYALLEQANRDYEQVKSQNLHPTRLSMYLNSSKVAVGGYLSAYGVLFAGSTPLGGRGITVYVDDVAVAKVSTQVNGEYRVVFRVPHKYVPYVTVKAAYSSEGSDRGTFYGSASPAQKVAVIYYSTVLDVSVPDVGYPGLALAVRGTVTSEEAFPLQSRQVKVFLDNSLVFEQLTDVGGGFSGQPIVDVGAKLGDHTLKVTVDSQGMYAGASLTRNFSVQKMPIYLQVDAPKFIVSPSTFEVTGVVTTEAGPLRNAKVTVRFADYEASATTLSDGTFSFMVEVPITSLFAGNQNLQVTVQPAQAWRASVTETVSVFVLNIVSVALTLAAIISVITVLGFRFSRSGSRKAGSSSVFEVSEVPFESAAVASEVLPLSKVKLGGLKAKVVKAYIEALNAVQSFTGLSLLFNMTLREYLRGAEPKLGSVAVEFSELTALAERSLYSPYMPTDQDLAYAESLAEKVREAQL